MNKLRALKKRPLGFHLAHTSSTELSAGVHSVSSQPKLAKLNSFQGAGSAGCRGQLGSYGRGSGPPGLTTRVVQGVLVFCHQRGDSPLSSAFSFLDELRLVVPSYEVCGYGCGELKSFSIFKFSCWGVFLVHLGLLPQVELLNLQLSIFPSTLQPLTGL